MDYILIPHFYRLNWAREMSEFLKGAEGFEYIGKDLGYGNYSKAGQLRDLYLNYLLDNTSKYKGRTLFFVNLNDYIFYSRRKESRDVFNIYGFMRGSRFFDGEPGNNMFSKDSLSDIQQIEAKALTEVDKVFVGSKAFGDFLSLQIQSLYAKKIEIVGIPIFIEPNFNIQKKDRTILWNHRLQKQKNPWVLFKLQDFVKRKISVCAPEALSAAYSKEMKEHEAIFRKIIRDNGKKRDRYLEELRSAKVVFSTSQHETWGNSMIEGIMNGAIPFAPDGELCSYKELYPREFLYPQELIVKGKDEETISDNMVQLSYLLDQFSRDDHANLLKDLQSELWEKFNYQKWVKRLL
jgi:glycosyltransferase involved in cell wall biosynthesis